MTLFQLQHGALHRVTEQDLKLEKDIPKLIETNLDGLIGLRFICGFEPDCYEIGTFK